MWCALGFQKDIAVSANALELSLFMHRNAGDNGYMPITPSGFVQQRQLTGEINEAVGKLDKADVSHVAFAIGDDSTGDPALFFRIVLTDEASSVDHLSEVADHVSTTLMDLLHPLENWGLIPYFSFRSYSEQQGLNDPEWS